MRNTEEGRALEKALEAQPPYTLPSPEPPKPEAAPPSVDAGSN